jgi:multidrug efflux pump subunit AcrA (membrane-fusion protein)
VDAFTPGKEPDGNARHGPALTDTSHWAWRNSALGVATAAADTATQLPVPGLPAQAAAPLAASAQVSAPYAGVVTRILVDEGALVRQGQPLARIQSRDVLAAQGELARARSEATAAALQAKRDAALLPRASSPPRATSSRRRARRPRKARCTRPRARWRNCVL